jgi:polyhydroxyalkanoate synthase
MATQTDFGSSSGLLGLFARERLEAADIIDHTGNVPAEVIYRMFRLLKPTSDLRTYASLWEKLWSEQYVKVFQAMTSWVRDQVPFPGAIAQQSIDLLLRRNALMSGELPLNGRRIRLSDVRCPLLNVMAAQDHIVPINSARPLGTLVGSQDVTDLVVPAGHIGLAVSAEAVRTTIPSLIQWLHQSNI